MRKLVLLVFVCGTAVAAQQRAAEPPDGTLPPLVAVRPIEPPRRPLPAEAASAGVTKFSFIAYGDTRSGGGPDAEDGRILHPKHSALVDLMLQKITALSTTPYAVRFAIQSGDAVLYGPNGAMWNVSFSPIIDKLTRGGGIPYFFAVGNHDVTSRPWGDPERMVGLHNTLTAMSRLIPPEGSPRRMSGYPTYAFGYGNLFAIAIDSNVASDQAQLVWVSDQLAHLDRRRYTHVVAFFHHPTFSSGPHGGDQVEPQTLAIRTIYAPLFRQHHVRMIIAGHDHLLDHFVEHYTDNGATYRRDDVVTGGGGAPIYLYKGEPDLTAYVAAGASQNVRVDHLLKPGRTTAANPHHFVVIQVDGDRLSLEVVSLDPAFAPYNGRARIELSDRVS